MRRIGILSIILFLVTGALFGYEKYREYMAEDTKPPQILMDEDSIKVKCGATNEELLSGITAKDSRDGDVTKNLVIESMSNFLKGKKRNMVVAAFDSAGNMSKATREVIYTDYRKPRYSLSEPIRYPMDSRNIEIGIKADDVIDGDITGRIKITGQSNIRLDKKGDYDITFSVSNSAGDVEKLPATFRVYDPEEERNNPQIKLKKYIVYTKKKNKVDYFDLVESVTVAGVKYERPEKNSKTLTNTNYNGTGERVYLGRDRFEYVDKNVKYKKPGTYEAIIRYTDNEGNRGSVPLIIVVR